MKRELQGVREKLQAQELKHDAVLSTLEDMRKRLDELRSEQSKQVDNSKIVSYCVEEHNGDSRYRGEQGGFSVYRANIEDFSSRCSKRLRAPIGLIKKDSTKRRMETIRWNFL